MILTIPGFGGTHHGGSTPRPVAERNEGGVEFLRVVLDPSCRLGHHVFADSANNGPVGEALTTELILSHIHITEPTRPERIEYAD